MKKSPQRKRQGVSRPQVQPVSALNLIREQYLAAGVTPQELAEIERVSVSGDQIRSALTIALVMARLEEDGLLGHRLAK